MAGWLLGAGADHVAVAAKRSTPACRVGGKPTLPQEVPESEGKVKGGPVVVGCGRSGGEPLELVAYATTKGSCFRVDRPAELREGGSQSFGCMPTIPWEEICASPCFAAFGAEPARGSKLTRTVVGGQALAPAARVVLTARLDGRPHDFRAVEAHVTASGLLRRLNLTRPFFFFAALLPHCYRAHAIRVAAFDESGALLARRPGEVLPPNTCLLPADPE
jgi:hypothetical protein